MRGAPHPGLGGQRAPLQQPSGPCGLGPAAAVQRAHGLRPVPRERHGVPPLLPHAGQRPEALRGRARPGTVHPGAGPHPPRALRGERPQRQHQHPDLRPEGRHPVRGRSLVRTGDAGQQHPLGPLLHRGAAGLPLQPAGAGRVRSGALALRQTPGRPGHAGARACAAGRTDPPEQELRGERGGGQRAPRRRGQAGAGAPGPQGRGERRGREVRQRARHRQRAQLRGLQREGRHHRPHRAAGGLGLPDGRTFRLQREGDRRPERRGPLEGRAGRAVDPAGLRPQAGVADPHLRQTHRHPRRARVPAGGLR